MSKETVLPEPVGEQATPAETPSVNGPEVGAAAGPGSDGRDGMSVEDLRRNMIALVSLEILFTVGATDLDIALNPLLVYLNASNTLIGVIRSFTFLGLAGLVISPYITRRFRYKKKLVFLTHIPYLGLWGVLGLAVLLSGRLGLEGSLLFIVVGLWAAQAFAGGFVSLPIQEFIASSIPTWYRGRFTGASFGIGGMASIGSAAIATLIIARLSKPESFGWCFIYSWFFAQIALALAFFAREQPSPIERQPTPWTREMFVAASSDRPYMKYLGFTVLVGAVFAPVWFFLPIYGMKDLEMPATSSGFLQMVIMSTRMLCSVTGGVLIDRLGPRRVLPLLPVIAAAAILPVILFPTPGAVYASTAISAVYQVVAFTGAAALIYGIPRREDRAGHYAIYFIVTMLSGALGNMLVGRMADLLGYHGTFVLYLGLYLVFVPISYYLVGPRAKGETI